MTGDLDVLLKRLHLANARRMWRDLVQRAEKEQWSHDHLLHTLFAEEVAHRRGTRLTRATRAAAFPFLRTVEEFDFTHQSTLRLTTIGSLLAPDFVTEGRSAILLGKPGRGKTHLAIAIAYRALQNGFDARFTTAAELIDDLSAASRDGRMRDVLADYVRPHVLVVDEVGYLTYGDDAANVLYHVVNDRHIRRRAMLFTTNKHPKQWGAALHDEDLAEAIVDRILERGRLLRLDGPSVRTKHLPGDELAGDLQDDSKGSRFSGIDAAEFPEPTDAPARAFGDDIQSMDEHGLLWFGNKVTYVFSDGVKTAFHYELRLSEMIRPDTGDHGGFIRLSRPIQELGGGMFLPIEASFERYLVPSGALEIAVKVNYDWFDLDNGRALLENKSA